MNTTSDFLPLSSSIKTTTILAMVIIIAAIVIMVNQWQQGGHSPAMRWTYIIVSAILVLTLLSAIIMIPRKVVVKENGINVHMLAWKINVPKEDIVSIEHYPNGIQSSRVVGMGGFFGNIGLFSSAQCGDHFSLVTDPMNVCVITRKSKRPIVVSVKDYSVFTSIIDVKEKY